MTPLRRLASCTFAAFAMANCNMQCIKVLGFIEIRQSIEIRPLINVNRRRIVRPFSQRHWASRLFEGAKGVDEHLNLVESCSTDGLETSPHLDKRSYLSNPGVTATALAHEIWKSVIIPYTDTVIDATCGNGKDSIVMSSLLFNLNSGAAPSKLHFNTHFTPQLICIDIQQRACENTFHSLSKHIQNPFILQNYITILNTSHDPLPKPNQDESVGLVCYNLGYLPGVHDKLTYATKTHSTISSMKDAAMILRVGGLLSIMIYPKSNALEAEAVGFFCESLARISSRDEASWRDYVDKLPTTRILENGRSLRDVILAAMTTIVSKNVDQTWRVFEHKPLGRSTSPTLITALRIK